MLAPRPPESDELLSVLTWRPGHAPPKLAIEIVSATNAEKDYSVAPDKYAACGAEELWVFDPKLVGPRAHGGPLRLQIWCRGDGGFVREYAGDGPARSPFLGAWVVVTDGGASLRVATDAGGNDLWLTEAEQERVAKDAALAAKDAALAAKDAAFAENEALGARLRELEARLASQGDPSGGKPTR